MSAVVIAIAALPTVSLLLMGLTRMESLLAAGIDEPVEPGLAESMGVGPVVGSEDVSALAA
jgi:hypothetical protein